MVGSESEREIRRTGRRSMSSAAQPQKADSGAKRADFKARLHKPHDAAARLHDCSCIRMLLTNCSMLCLRLKAIPHATHVSKTCLVICHTTKYEGQVLK